MVEVNKIYNEDCMKTMARMPDGFIDLTVTSPLYDNLRTYKDSIGETWGEHIWKPIIKELYRATKDGGVVVWVVNDATIKGSETGTSFRQALWAMDCGFRLHDTMFYHKVSCTLNHNRYEQEIEYMFVLSKGRPKTFNPIRIPCKLHGKDSNRTGQHYSKHSQKKCKVRSKKNRENVKPDKIKGNVWTYNTGFGHSTKDKFAFKHPAIFPERLANDHIISWSNEGDLVYDPFMGSGTTAKMALLNNRNFIGSELVDEYYRIAKKRIFAIH